MRITKIILDDFKSFEGKHELLLTDFTTLIGTNASGKTNVIEGITILSHIVKGANLSAYFNNYGRYNDTIRGGVIGCCRGKKKSFSLGCVLKDDKDMSEYYYDVKIEILDEEKILISNESLYESNKDEKRTLIFRTEKKDKNSGDLNVEYNNEKKGKNPKLKINRSQSIISQINDYLSISENTILMMKDVLDDRFLKSYHEDINQLKLGIVNKIESVRNSISEIFIIDPSPHKIREYIRPEVSLLRKDGSNLSAVIDRLVLDDNRLKIKKRHKETKYQVSEKELKRLSESSETLSELISILNEFLDLKLLQLSILRTPAPLRDIILCIEEENNEKNIKIPAALLSEGTLRITCIFTGLLTLPKGSYIVIDEFDNGIHHSKSYEYMKRMKVIAQRRGINLILSTHNSYLLNNYDKENIYGITIVYRDKDLNNSQLINLLDIKNIERLFIDGGIGDAAIEGVEKYIYPPKHKKLLLGRGKSNE